MLSFVLISEQWNNRADARAVMPHQQMKPVTPRYPVDRYLVQSSKNFEMVNIIDDVIWNEEPLMRPEDEIILRKLHEMLQSTADDLRQLSGELVKFHQPGVQVKSLPTPLDEEFNEKVHIEEIVNAKFYGHETVKPLIEQTNTRTKSKPNDLVDRIKGNDMQTITKSNNGLSFDPKMKKTNRRKNLQISKTRILQIREENITREENLSKRKPMVSVPVVSYNEFTFTYEEPKESVIPKKRFQVQEMPKINIRSELQVQKVLQLDIMPDTCTNDKRNLTNENNVTVLAINHEADSITHKLNTKPNIVSKSPHVLANITGVRKISKMSTCESSESTNNISSDAKYGIKTQKVTRAGKLTPTKCSARVDRTKRKINLQPATRNHNRVTRDLNEWMKKINKVYSKPTSARKPKSSSKVFSDTSTKKPLQSMPQIAKGQTNVLNNAEYIPYTQFTLGGVRVSDIENEISNITYRNDMPLSPILDKILSSRENSFNDSPRKRIRDKSSKILNTSDENLLQEVLDIEKIVRKTLSKNIKIEIKSKDKEACNEVLENYSYDDDFEDEKSDQSEKLLKANDSSSLQSSNSTHNNISQIHPTNNDCKTEPETFLNDIQNKTYTKPALSLKDSVDVFEFIHSVDTQDTATQSMTANKISLKETQTSPRNERSSIKPIHNDLWSSVDPMGEVDDMFKLEKEMIKKFIIDEYGDMFQKSIAKPSSSKIFTDKDELHNNVASLQKVTQTSPARVKSVMTSPTKNKTRPTSPIDWPNNTYDRHTSPLKFTTNEEILCDNDSISINLSSPRFTLRLPKNSRQVITNLESSKLKDEKAGKIFICKDEVSSSSSLDADNSSSEISSLGEVKLRLERALTNRVSSLSESSSSSKNTSDMTSILPIRSEGEISLGQTKRRNYKPGKSDGEMSLGVLMD